MTRRCTVTAIHHNRRIVLYMTRWSLVLNVSIYIWSWSQLQKEWLQLRLGVRIVTAPAGAEIHSTLGVELIPKFWLLNNGSRKRAYIDNHEIDFQFQNLAIKIVTNNIKGSKSIFKCKMCARNSRRIFTPNFTVNFISMSGVDFSSSRSCHYSS